MALRDLWSITVMTTFSKPFRCICTAPLTKGWYLLSLPESGLACWDNKTHGQNGMQESTHFFQTRSRHTTEPSYDPQSQPTAIC